jgi:3-hydroxyisobutyrate dehydrogenase-like beta-hydroxyacid dehydrogenase
MLDAPVSGSVPQVQSGTLTIMVGGDEQAYSQAEPVLQVSLWCLTFPRKHGST